MMHDRWLEEFPGAVTVCDADGTILYMNARSRRTFEANGGGSLVGKSVFDCHPEPARTKLKNLMKDKASNSYTIEKNGVKKLIHQSPWYEGGKYMGFVEMSIEIPSEMPHFIRKALNPKS